MSKKIKKNKVEKRVPTPSGSESESTFIKRCMGDSHMVNSFPDNETRLAVCYDSFRATKSIFKKLKILKSKIKNKH